LQGLGLALILKTLCPYVENDGAEEQTSPSMPRGPTSSRTLIFRSLHLCATTSNMHTLVFPPT